jgi:hypothetical protein
MNYANLYYKLKPILPRRLQISLRRALAARRRAAHRDDWPIHPAAGRAPADWTGWPQAKKFALVLTHDVETAAGRDKCLALMAVEERLGFRSAFNFVPEDYPQDEALRARLGESGFEVGVHGLKHDGKLFESREKFLEKSERINGYLKSWGAVGFRAPSMQHNLEWIADLEIEYDCSTYDTDPFEPESDNMETIFPFWHEAPSKARGYVELPYTLPQDHCLFVILKEKGVSVWGKKLDWIAENGGMALLNTHPDYMNFGDRSPSLEEYPIDYYADFLKYAKRRYGDLYWHVLPRDLSRFWRDMTLKKTREQGRRYEK